MLKRIIGGETDPTRLLGKQVSTSDRMAFGYLERNRLIDLEEGRYTVAGDVAFSLGLTDFPTRPRRK
jgi:hypothetical protein